jgi:Domain of unknown function (DUF4386)
MTTEAQLSKHIHRPAKEMPLRLAALTAGFGLLIMVLTAPVSELFAYPKLVVANNMAQTIQNITTHKVLFLTAIFGYLITFISDIVVAWALYILLRPVHEQLSLLTAIFRWIYTAIALAALLNMITVFRMLNTSDYVNIIQPDQLNTQVALLLKSFKSSWNFGLIFFAFHLGLLGYMVLRSDYIPGIIGILLMITGLGYLLTSLRPYLLPHVNVDFAKYTYYGELVFMLWLIIKGWRIKEFNYSAP